MNIKKIFATNLRHYRKLKGWTQEDFAESLGTDRTYVSSMERGIRNPSIEVVAKIAAVLEVEPDKLIRALNQE